jgi:hypothetical protein
MDAGGLKLIVDDAFRSSLSPSRIDSLKRLIKLKTGMEAHQLAVDDPGTFEEVVDGSCGNAAPLVLEDIVERIFKDVLPGYDISVYSMRCDRPGRYRDAVMEYRKAADAQDTMLGMEDRDHIACCYTSRVHRDQMVYSFVMRGISKNQLNVLVVNLQERRMIENLLFDCGVDLDSLIQSGRLVFFGHDELYGDNLGSSFDPVKRRLTRALDAIRSQGLAGMNIIGTIAGNLAQGKRYSRCAMIEQSWHEIIPAFPVPITLLCPYLKSTVTKTARAELVPCHNRGLVCEAMHA